jgi:glycosyltransferase involved in cell wall biosynthesis
VNLSAVPDRPRIINLSDQSPAWQWLRTGFADSHLDWHHISSHSFQPALPLLRDRQARLQAARRALHLARQAPGPAVLVSHGPRPANYLGNLLAPGDALAHLVFSFNFTTLPQGLERQAMRRAFRRVDRFVVASTLERRRYAAHFDLDPGRIDFLPWGVRPPERASLGAPLVAGPYLCALGSQARDYATLARAMQRLPHLKLVLVATPDSVAGVPLPDNIELRTNIPRAEAHNLLAHSQAMILPLADDQAACGHVTVVSAMQLGVPVVASRCEGLTDYLVDEQSGLLTAVGDAASLAQAVARLQDDPALAQRLALAAQAFADQHCQEACVVRYFRQFLASLSVPAARSPA